MDEKLIGKAKEFKELEYIFCDYYDTIIHRTVHPLKPFKIWAKAIKRDLKIQNTVNEIFQLRRSSMRTLSKSLHVAESEVRYDVVMREIYDGLNLSVKTSFETFVKCAYEADFKAEAGVQYLNKKMIKSLRQLKKEGYKIYCVSDFHSDEAMLIRLMKFHGIDDIYDKTFVSASQKASKENNGLIFEKILKKEQIAAHTVLMIGDNPVSDVANAELHGIESHYLKRTSYKIRQKFYFGLLMIEDFMGI